MPQLDTATYVSQIFWMLLSFGTLCFFMVWVVSPRFARIISDRHQTISSCYEDVRILDQKIDALKEDIELRRSLFRKEMVFLTQQATEEINHLREEKLKNYDYLLAQEIDAAKAMLAENKQKILRDSSELVVQTVLLALPRLFLTPPTEERVREVVISVLKKQEGSHDSR